MNNTYRISAELDNVTMAYIDNKNFEEADWKTDVFSRGYVCEHEGDLCDEYDKYF